MTNYLLVGSNCRINSFVEGGLDVNKRVSIEYDSEAYLKLEAGDGAGETLSEG